MLTKNKSKQIKQLKYLLLVPVLASMLFYTACANNETEVNKAPENYKAKIEKDGKIYYVISNEEGKTITIEELGKEVDLKSVLTNGSKVYDENGQFLSKVEETEFVPFTTLDKAPTFPGCAEGNKDCFSNSMHRFIAKNFNAELANQLGLQSGKKRIYVQFKIDETGKVVEIKSRAPHPKLAEEAERVVQLLPQFSPGEKDGKVVKTGYTLPITLNIY